MTDLDFYMNLNTLVEEAHKAGLDWTTIVEDLRTPRFSHGFFACQKLNISPNSIASKRKAPLRCKPQTPTRSRLSLPPSSAWRLPTRLSRNQHDDCAPDHHCRLSPPLSHRA